MSKCRRAPLVKAGAIVAAVGSLVWFLGAVAALIAGDYAEAGFALAIALAGAWDCYGLARRVLHG